MKKHLWKLIFLALPLALFFAAREAASWRPVEVARHPGALKLWLSPDEKWLATQSPHPNEKIKGLRVWRLDVAPSEFKALNCDGDFEGWSPDSRLMVTSGVPASVFGSGPFPGTFWPHQLQLLSPATLQPDKLFRSLQHEIQSWQFSTDGRNLWALTSAERLHFDGATTELKQVRPWGKRAWRRNVTAQIAPDGRNVLVKKLGGHPSWNWNFASAQTRRLDSLDRTVWLDEKLLWHTSDGFWITRLSDGKMLLDWGDMVRWKQTPDKRFLALVGVKDIVWFDIKAQRIAERTRFEHQFQNWHDIAFSSDRDFAYTLEKDGRVLRWRLR